MKTRSKLGGFRGLITWVLLFGFFLMKLTLIRAIKTEGKKAKNPFKGAVSTRYQILGGLEVVTVLDKNVVEL